MPSSMLARSSEKPIRGAPIVEREYVPDIGSEQHARCRPCTRSLPLALISSRLPAEAWRKIALECSPLGQARDGGRTVRGRGRSAGKKTGEHTGCHFTQFLSTV